MSGGFEDEELPGSKEITKAAEELDPRKLFEDPSGNSSIPVIVGSRLYVGCGNTFYCLDSGTGKVVWKFLTGGRIAASPFVKDKVVYVPSFDSYLYALNEKDGSLIWKFRAGDKIFSNPMLADGVLYFTCLDQNLYAVEAASGRKRWSFRTANALWAQPAVINETVYFGASDNHFYAVSKDGRERWRFRTNGWVSVYAMADEKGGELWNFMTMAPARSAKFFICLSSWNDKLYLLDENGRVVWERHTASKMSAPVIEEGVIYAGSHDKKIYALSLKDGSEIWSYQTGDILTAPPLVEKKIIYTGSYDGWVYALDRASGQLRWKMYIGGPIVAAVKLDEDMLYVPSWNALCAISIKKHKIIWTFQTGASSDPTFIKWIKRFESGKSASLKKQIVGGPQIGTYVEAALGSETQSAGTVPYKARKTYERERTVYEAAPEYRRKKKRSL